MSTIKIKIKEKSKAGKALRSFLEILKTQPGIEISEESPYDPEFVKKIKEAEKRGDYTEVDPNDVWGSLGLK